MGILALALAEHPRVLAYTPLQLRSNGGMGGGASEWHSMRGRTRSVRRSIDNYRGIQERYNYLWPISMRAPTARPIVRP